MLFGVQTIVCMRFSFYPEEVILSTSFGSLLKVPLLLFLRIAKLKEMKQRVIKRVQKYMKQVLILFGKLNGPGIVGFIGLGADNKRKELISIDTSFHVNKMG